MKPKQLVVSLPARRVGDLTQDRGGLVRWTPDESWERAGQTPRLGLEFLRREGPRTNASDLPTWFENLLPERDTELRERLSSAAGLREGQSFELLRVYGRDLIGAVEVRGITSRYLEGLEETPLDGLHDSLFRGDDPKAEVEAGRSQRPSDAGIFVTRMSALTGVQLKFSMSMVNERLVVSAHGRDRAWLVKMAGEKYPELAAVEQSTMTWARLSGFVVPEHFAVDLDRLDGIPPGWVHGQEPAFAIQRFDRRDDGTKIHQEDLCQALELRPHNKYGDRGPRVSFEGALRLVNDVCGEADGREMARRIGFMLASGNTDAHLKNWSLVWGDRARPTLSPCYDLVATISYPDKMGWQLRDGPTLALRLADKQRFGQVDLASLDAFARATVPYAKEEVISGVKRARDAWRDASEGAPERMREAISEHWAAVPLLVSLGGLST